MSSLCKRIGNGNIDVDWRRITPQVMDSFIYFGEVEKITEAILSLS